MDTRFRNELEQLKISILQMAALTERALQQAVRALLERNEELADEVIDGDQVINLIEVDVDRDCLRLLALEQPMARDLRFTVGCLRIAGELERIADLAVNIAERARFLSSRPPLPPNPSLEKLAHITVEMYSKVVTSFVNEDSLLAREVCMMDDTADEYNVAVLKHLLDYMVNETPAVERSVHTIIVSRCFERAADQVTNIAESVIFINEGVNIKHHCQRG